MRWRHFRRRFSVGGGRSNNFLEEVRVAESAASALHLPELLQERAAAVRLRGLLDLVQLCL